MIQQSSRMLSLPSEPIEQITRPSGKRTYKKGDKEFPSATTALGIINKPALVNWAAKQERIACMETMVKMHVDQATASLPTSDFALKLEGRIGETKAFRKTMEQAATIGTEVHDRVEDAIKSAMGLEVQTDQSLSTPEAQRAFAHFEKWADSVNFEPIAIERIVWSDGFGYAGTVDWVAYVNGELTVGDWKTGKAIYPEAWLQVSAYAMALIEEGAIQAPVNVCIARLPKLMSDPEANVEVRKWGQAQESFLAFVHALNLSNAMKQI